jgi:hypothetical protein
MEALCLQMACMALIQRLMQIGGIMEIVRTMRLWQNSASCHGPCNACMKQAAKNALTASQHSTRKWFNLIIIIMCFCCSVAGPRGALCCRACQKWTHACNGCASCSRLFDSRLCLWRIQASLVQCTCINTNAPQKASFVSSRTLWLRRNLLSLHGLHEKTCKFYSFLLFSVQLRTFIIYNKHAYGHYDQTMHYISLLFPQIMHDHHEDWRSNPIHTIVLSIGMKVYISVYDTISKPCTQKKEQKV